MSDPAFVTLNGVRARSVNLYVPWTGVPYAELKFDTSVPLPTGPVTLALGALSLIGVVDTTRSGDYALATSMAFLGGAGGWRKTVTPKPFHNDASTGVKRSAVLSATAAEVGETVNIATGLDSTIAADFDRESCPATRVIEQLYPTTQWFVDVAGVTQVGPRSSRDVTGKVELLEADTVRRSCVLAADDPTDLLPGCTLTDSRLPGGFTIHDVEINIEGGKARATCFSGTGRDDRLRALFKTLARESVPANTFFGMFECRVVRMNVDRAELQMTSKLPGLPDMLPVSLGAGLAGTWAKLAPGLLVLVQFINGDPGRPLIVHYSTKADPSFLPVQVTLDASDDVSIGLSASSVHIGGREPILTALATANGRPVCYGDIVTGPVSLGAPLTLIPFVSQPDLSRIKTKP